MTTEQKANMTREQAIEIVKTQYPHDHVMKTALGLLIPELRESEDEQTRRQLIEFISDIKRISESGRESWAIREGDIEMCNAFLAYLEKQKEKNGEDEECTDFTIYHPLKDGKGEYECIPYSFYGSLTSFSEDKDLIDFLRTCFYTKEECNEWIEQQKEQKPAEWSKEDERMRNQLIYDVEHHKKEGLISAKQNKATKALYNEIERCYDEKIAWLKSLRPVSKESLQPHWKPSEEQMDALKELIDDAHRDGWVTPGAAELYAQLKKLM